MIQINQTVFSEMEGNLTLHRIEKNIHSISDSSLHQFPLDGKNKIAEYFDMLTMQLNVETSFVYKEKVELGLEGILLNLVWKESYFVSSFFVSLLLCILAKLSLGKF